MGLRARTGALGLRAGNGDCRPEKARIAVLKIIFR